MGTQSSRVIIMCNYIIKYRHENVHVLPHLLKCMHKVCSPWLPHPAHTHTQDPAGLESHHNPMRTFLPQSSPVCTLQNLLNVEIKRNNNKKTKQQAATLCSFQTKPPLSPSLSHFEITMVCDTFVCVMNKSYK